MPRRRELRIADAILDQLLAGADPNGLLDDLKKALAERALNAEMDHPLAAEGGTGNGRNGDGRKTVVTNTGKRDLQIPRDRRRASIPLLGHSLEFVASKDRKAVAAALKNIYRVVDAAAGEAALSAFEKGPWGRKYAALAQSWRRAWGEVVPFYAFPGEVRRLLYNPGGLGVMERRRGGTGSLPRRGPLGRAPSRRPWRDGRED